VAAVAAATGASHWTAGASSARLSQPELAVAPHLGLH